MDATVKQYSVSLFPCSEPDGAPCSAVRMEINCDFEKFYELARKWIDNFSRYHSNSKNGPQFLMRDGIHEDLPVSCTEDQIILSMLYCCKDLPVTVTELNRKGTVYTDISDITVLEHHFFGDDQYSDVRFSIYPVKVTAKKDEKPLIIYFFGPDFGQGFSVQEKITSYPLSRGVVETDEHRLYAGTYIVNVEENYWGPEWEIDEFGDEIYHEQVYHHHEWSELAQLFLEVEGNDLTFSVLLDGTLCPKMRRTDEAIIFYDTVFELGEDGVSPSFLPDGQSISSHDAVFRNVNGKYLYAMENKRSDSNHVKGVTFTPPETPVLGLNSQDAAKKLWYDYVDAVDAAFAAPEETTSSHGYVYKRDPQTGLYTAQTDDFVLSGTVEPTISDKSRLYQYLTYDFDVFGVKINIERAVFTDDGVTVSLIPKDGPDLAIELVDSVKTRRATSFDELRKWNVFAGANLPETPLFRVASGYFERNLQIYQAIKQAILKFGVKKLLRVLIENTQKSNAEDMKKALYDEDMTPDPEFLSFAIEQQNKYQRTGQIPNIALLGEAGTGKTTMVERLAEAIFHKKVLKLSPSDLKGAYVGQTKFEVVAQLKQAVQNKQIFFVDEAYELMEDEYGREAVTILLPLMTMNGDKITLTAHYEHSSITLELTKDQVPPIWISGYEEDTRLMMARNQGFFRRFKRATLKTPTTNDLYEQLLKKLKDARNKLLRQQNSNLFEYTADMSDTMELKFSTLIEQFEQNSKLVISFFRWGTQPQNSKYFANHAGVSSFIDRCLDSIDFYRTDKEITRQIEQIITSTKRDIKHQLDTIRRKGDNGVTASFDDSERIEMIFDNETRFKDLDGCDSQIEYMKTVIDLFLNKSDYEKHHITIPKGALLLGNPGVGKTFIARAMAGELQERFKEEAPDKRVGFMSLSAPMITTKPISFIGNIFDKAEEYDVCVIFIDEVDAIAMNRSQNSYYHHFIELIKQMDGIEQRSNIFVLAATNAPESLDPAFTRSGRIDKQLTFTLPDLAARRKLARRFLEKRRGKLPNSSYENGADMLTEKIANLTPGCTPGDIEGIINSAFVMYSQERQAQGWKPLAEELSEFGDAELTLFYHKVYEAVERHTDGDPRPKGEETTFNPEKNDDSRSAVAIHEVGHALVEIMHGNSFEKITSLPRGDALGYVKPNPSELITKADYENFISTAMGGRIAEEVVFGEKNVSRCAYGDMCAATNYARTMVERLGFSDKFQFMVLEEDVTRHLGESEYSCSELFREQSDQAVNELLQRLYQETRELLKDKKETIITLARQVFERETMTGEEFAALYQELAEK